MAEPWSFLFTASLVVLGVLILACVLRAFRGPRTADRLLAVNMISTLVIVSVCILSLLLDEGYLADVALLFCLLGFLAVAVLSRILPEHSAARVSGGKKAHDGK